MTNGDVALKQMFAIVYGDLISHGSIINRQSFRMGEYHH